ncbi:MAG: BLUF domain-containing protein [Chitinophagaceae bacterium]
MKEKTLYMLSYVSTACDCLKYESIQAILESSTKNNKNRAVTGILVYCNKHFFQILEGEKEHIDSLFEEINIDSRHDGIIKIEEKPIQKRMFENWHMAFKSYNCELKKLDNFKMEEFYSYINAKLQEEKTISLQILLEFFDLNG